MNISEVKKALEKLNRIGFILPNGEPVPGHFHVTEVGKITKHFIDCGGKERTEVAASFQLWDSSDFDHRLHPEKLTKIIEISEKVLGKDDLEIEVEYQADTIGKYGLDFDGENFLLITKHTDCLAKSSCGTSPVQKISINGGAVCSPDSGCC